MCRAAAEALGEIGDARAVEPLIAALKDGVEDVRTASAEALGELGGARAVENLIHCLEDENANVRIAVARVLSDIGDARILGPFIQWFVNEDLDVRETFTGMLGKLGGVRVLDTLFQQLRDECRVMRRNAAKTLVKMYRNKLLWETLDEQSKKSILAVRETITEPHQDVSGCNFHKDTGIGVDFSL